jgi:hypothetical protein
VISRWEIQEDVEAKGQSATVIEINKSVKEPLVRSMA